jgi:hypothetical protein
MMRRTLVVGAFLALASACGGKTDVDNGGGGSGGATGGSGGATGGTTSGGSGGATGGAGGIQECDALLKSYGSTLSQAKKCNPFINSIQCTQQVDDNIDCGCPTYVNPDNKDELLKLLAIVDEWNSLQCDQWINCGGAMCQPPQGSGCVPDDPAGMGPEGHCQDYWPD